MTTHSDKNAKPVAKKQTKARPSSTDSSTTATPTAAKRKKAPAAQLATEPDSAPVETQLAAEPVSQPPNIAPTLTLEQRLATVQQDKLVQAIETATKAVPLVGKAELIDRLRLTTDQQSQTLTLTGFNLIVGIAVTIPANVVGSGDWTLSGSRLLQLIQNFPAGAITLTWAPGTAMSVLSKTAGPFAIATRMADDCPTIPVPAQPQVFDLPAHTRWGLGCAVACAGEEAFRCVHMRFWAPANTAASDTVAPTPVAGLTFTSTKKEAVVAFYNSTAPDTDLAQPNRVVSVAGEVLRKLMPLLHEHPFSVELDSGDTEDVVVRFLITQKESTEKTPLLADQSTVRTVFTCRTDQVEAFDGNDYSPGDTSPVAISIDREQLIRALRRQTVFTDKKAAVTITVGDGELTLSSAGDGIGEGTDTVSAQIQGEHMEIKFDPELLLEILQQLVSSQVQISLSSPQEPAYLRDSERQTLFFLLMPSA